MDNERLEALLAKIDPSIRRKRLQADKESLEQQYLGALTDARIQDTLVSGRTSLGKTLDGALLMLFENEQSQALYQQQVRWMIVEIMATELEKVILAIGELDGAGIIPLHPTPAP